MVSQVRGRCNICGEKDLRAALVQKMQTDIISCRLTPQIRAHYTYNKLVLTVTDNGIGMDEAALENLRHQIVHGRKPSAEKNRRSTGIGLHNIEARLRLYAGASDHVTVQSRPGFGTRVRIELPWKTI